MTDQSPTQDDPTIAVTEAIRAQVRDANDLLDFAIQTGLKKPEGGAIAPDIVSVMKITAARVGLGQPTTDSAQIRASELARFDIGYCGLAEFTSPVTADSLRDTRTEGDAFLRPSPAQRFTRLLWAIAVFFVLAVLTGGYITQSPDAATDPPDKLVQLATLLTPWAYGGLGACAYLLRSAHVFIHQRTFDVRRKPEYLNRILLGAISGGAVIVLINQLTDQSGAQINLSSAALGFIAGYSTDFLFNTVERIVSAILPKVSLESVQKGPATSPKPAIAFPEAGMTLKDLIERMDKAQGNDKELYRSLITKLRDRL